MCCSICKDFIGAVLSSGESSICDPFYVLSVKVLIAPKLKTIIMQKSLKKLSCFYHNDILFPAVSLHKSKFNSVVFGLVLGLCIWAGRSVKAQCVPEIESPNLKRKVGKEGLKNARCHSHVITSALSVIKNRLSWGTKDKPQCIKGLSRDRIQPLLPLMTS
ncbi:hypothetical protein CEXT_397491 [Caerostris extrusa]|uniref:Uncharacterized protein n=1 Tax=Caerostris extrusa TaxID=172846 RepID=A0AAV4Q0W6_CAEEX|nr:hypothetical protein CEXT_397491 [Caerostris extrusa]